MTTDERDLSTNIILKTQKHNLKLIEDAACALGAAQNNKLVGSFGDMASFSLHPRKAISSGEGGLITTNNYDLAQNCRILRNHGIHRTNGKNGIRCSRIQLQDD